MDILEKTAKYMSKEGIKIKENEDMVLNELSKTIGNDSNFEKEKTIFCKNKIILESYSWYSLQPSR